MSISVAGARWLSCNQEPHQNHIFGVGKQFPKARRNIVIKREIVIQLGLWLKVVFNTQLLFSHHSHP